jgi:hypothetical protein
MNAPCKDCSDRHQGCHCECEKYKVFRKERDELNALKHEANEKYYNRFARYNESLAKRYKENMKGWY